MIDVLVWRDPREAKVKCSLTPIAGLAGVRIVEVRGRQRIEVGERVLLAPEGEELTSADRGLGLLLIDCAWRKVGALRRRVDGVLHERRLPRLVTAYPRRSKTFQDPEEGLASIEALFAATLILGEPRLDFLDGYRWREEFLRTNFPDLAGRGVSGGELP